MTRLPITPGVKERVSANVGRIVAPYWAASEDEDVLISNALKTAIEIERQLTAALTPEDDE